jgi:hypothetical protein
LIIWSTIRQGVSTCCQIRDAAILVGS